MDKTPQQLDPKLKEAYDRVMGTVVTPKPPQAQPQVAQPIPGQPAAIPNPAAPQTPPTLIPQEKNAFTRKKKGISPLILILGAIVLLAVYAFVWIKVFGVKLF
jgi:hypothetical protein